MKNELLIANNFINIPNNTETVMDKNSNKNIMMIGTILNNMSYYGFIPSASAYEALNQLSEKELVDFWKDVEPAFKEITGDNRNMAEFVVYKNFPKEVLEMSKAQYWIGQILMYWGLPNELFTEDKEERNPLIEQKRLKVLALADTNTLENIYTSLVKNTSRWSDKQQEYSKDLYKENKYNTLNMDSFSFKENGIVLVNEVLKDKEAIKNTEININTATDVLRLAIAMSEGDISLRENSKLRKFSRPERHFFLQKLENATNLVEDIGLRKEQFKKFISHLHPGDYKFNKVKEAYNSLYKDEIKTFNSKVEIKLIANDASVLIDLQERPGDFFRRFHALYAKFDIKAIDDFKSIIPDLKTIQLVKLDNYLLSINDRKQLMYAPNGNWTKAKIADNKKVQFKEEDLTIIRGLIGDEVSSRLNHRFPQGIDLDMNVDNIKLQTNDQKLATYGRGTVFSIPDEMKFIRSASYWENKSHGSTWFDNGWNFFDDEWKTKGTSCWNHTHDMGDGATFSGDPTNAKDLLGRACQMIDLNLDQLEQQGVKYAVWNILSYSGIKFDDANDVLATLQWGEKAQEGNLYEPSRAQMVFPINGQSLTKYIAYVDVVERKLVYMDANLYGSVHSAGNNAGPLSEKMPAYVEYLKSLPSLADLFIHAKQGETPIWYSDITKKIEKEQEAYVFKPENASNDFTKIDLSEILDGGKVESPKKSFKR